MVLTKVVFVTICVEFKVSTFKMERPPVQSRKTSSLAEKERDVLKGPFRRAP